jgi:hemerythrin
MSKNHFILINKKLDKEHEDIIQTIDKLYKLCDKHWKTEDALFKKGESQMPTGHPNIKKELKEHRQHHKNLLNEIKIMKGVIIDHINEEDASHFHWLF